MCGIVGFTGAQSAGPLLLDGLKRLEYRGYDSAGISLLNGDSVLTVKSIGKVVNLEAKRPAGEKKMHTGIAHTR